MAKSGEPQVGIYVTVTESQLVNEILWHFDGEWDDLLGFILKLDERVGEVDFTEKLRKKLKKALKNER